jgi:hypothetical protein
MLIGIAWTVAPFPGKGTPCWTRREPVGHDYQRDVLADARQRIALARVRASASQVGAPVQVVIRDGPPRRQSDGFTVL